MFLTRVFVLCFVCVPCESPWGLPGATACVAPRNAPRAGLHRHQIGELRLWPADHGWPIGFNRRRWWPNGSMPSMPMAQWPNGNASNFIDTNLEPRSFYRCLSYLTWRTAPAFGLPLKLATCPYGKLENHENEVESKFQRLFQNRCPSVSEQPMLFQPLGTCPSPQVMRGGSMSFCKAHFQHLLRDVVGGYHLIHLGFKNCSFSGIKWI